MPKTFDIAAFQVEGVHEDAASAFFDSCGAHGLTTYAQFNERIVNRRGDFFEIVKPALTEIEYIHLEARPDWDDMTQRAEAVAPKALFFNSFQRDSVVNVARNLDRSTWGVIHNPKMFRKSAGCMDFVREGKLEAIVLAPHVAVAVEEHIPELAGHIHLHHPVGWAAGGAASWTPPAPNEPLDILIPGTVDYAGRSFVGLLDYLETTDLSDVRPFKCSIVAGGPDRADFEHQIATRGLSRFFDVEPLDPVTNRVPHANLMARMSRSHVLMPMLPPERIDFLTSKISTSLSMIKGTARPSVLPRHVADIYEMPALNSPKDAPFDLRGLDLSTASLSAMRCDMLTLYARLTGENNALIETLMKRL